MKKKKVKHDDEETYDHRLVLKVPLEFDKGPIMTERIFERVYQILDPEFEKEVAA